MRMLKHYGEAVFDYLSISEQLIYTVAEITVKPCITSQSTVYKRPILVQYCTGKIELIRYS